MDARTTTRPLRSLHAIFTRRLVAEEPPPPRLRTLAAQALWLGLAAGLAEAAVIVGHRTLVGTVSDVSVWHHWHHVSFGLMAHLAIFSAWFVASALLTCRWLRLRRCHGLTTFLGWFLALASPLLAVEQLHWISSLVAACGLSLRVTPAWNRHRGAILRKTLLPLTACAIAVAGSGFAWVQTAEDRALAALPPAKAEAPNVVLLVLDTVRADHLSLYGYGRQTTPRLQALARDAIVFDFARAPSSWTLPSHATMFTGRWPHELSVDTDRPLDSTYPTLAEFLSGHGYVTGGFVGNTFYCNSWFGLDRGFTRYEDSEESREFSAQQVMRCAAVGRALMPLAVQAGVWDTSGDFAERKTAAMVNDDALEWLDARDGRPFFLFLNYIDAHGPYRVPEDFPRAYSKLSSDEIIAANQKARRRGNDKRLSQEERTAALAELGRIGGDAYDDCLRYVDEQAGRLLDELQRRDLRRNTWIIITSDHGEHFGEKGNYWHGNTLYRPLVDVPLLIVPPSGPSGIRVSEVVSLRDLPATVADLIGQSSESRFPGRSLRRCWDPSAASAPGPDDIPRSELKSREDLTKGQGVPTGLRLRTALVDGGRIFHRDPKGQDELYDVDDLLEEADLDDDPDEAPALERFRSLDDPDRAIKP